MLKYPSNEIIDDARCVGSQIEKTIKNSKNNTIISAPDYLLNKGLEQGEEAYNRDNYWNETQVFYQPNYSFDLERMTTLGILEPRTDLNYGDEYLLASRYSRITPYGTDFGVKCVYGVLDERVITSVNTNGTSSKGYPDRLAYFRPVLHLSPSVKIKNDGGNGSFAKPFVLE